MNTNPKIPSFNSFRDNLYILIEKKNAEIFSKRVFSSNKAKNYKRTEICPQCRKLGFSAPPCFLLEGGGLFTRRREPVQKFIERARFNTQRRETRFDRGANNAGRPPLIRKLDLPINYLWK